MRRPMLSCGPTPQMTRDTPAERMTTRIGIATGYDPALDVRAFAGIAREVDERGYEIAFFSETIALMRDSVTAMAAFALASQRVSLGCTQVVRLRSPVTMAQTLASLDELSGGRMVLCPGAATRCTHGASASRPRSADRAHRMGGGHPPRPHGRARELPGHDRRVRRCSSAGRRSGGTSLWIAATSATGLRLAGRIGDGVLLNTVASPDTRRTPCASCGRPAGGRAGPDVLRGRPAHQHVRGGRPRDRLDAVRWEVATKFLPGKFRARPPRACASASRGSTRPSCRASRRPSRRADPRVSPAPFRRRGSRASPPAARQTKSCGGSSATARPA